MGKKEAPVKSRRVYRSRNQQNCRYPRMTLKPASRIERAIERPRFIPGPFGFSIKGGFFRCRLSFPPHIREGRLSALYAQDYECIFMQANNRMASCIPMSYLISSSLVSGWEVANSAPDLRHPKGRSNWPMGNRFIITITIIIAAYTF
jgi:hypothetical protein